MNNNVAACISMMASKLDQATVIHKPYYIWFAPYDSMPWHLFLGWQWREGREMHDNKANPLQQNLYHGLGGTNFICCIIQIYRTYIFIKQLTLRGKKKLCMAAAGNLKCSRLAM